MKAKKSKLLNIRVTSKEAADLRRKAKAGKQNLSEYLRNKIFSV